MVQEHSEHRTAGLFGPRIEEVNSYFASQDFPAEEGEVFYFYYQAMGWCGENGMPLRDWRLAASDWLFNLDQ